MADVNPIGTAYYYYYYYYYHYNYYEYSYNQWPLNKLRLIGRIHKQR